MVRQWLTDAELRAGNKEIPKGQISNVAARIAALEAENARLQEQVKSCAYAYSCPEFAPNVDGSISAASWRVLVERLADMLDCCAHCEVDAYVQGQAETLLSEARAAL